MGVSILSGSFVASVLVRASRESSPLRTLHSKMGWLSERTGLSLGIPEPCYMNRDYLYFCGQRLAI